MGARGRRRAVAPYQMRPLGLGGRPRAAVQLDGPSQAERGVSMKIAPMKIAVVGAGAIGGYFGGLLARAGHDVTLIARGAHRDAIRSRGLTVNSKDDSRSEEHTSELQSLMRISYAVFCLQKKKNRIKCDRERTDR